MNNAAGPASGPAPVIGVGVCVYRRGADGPEVLLIRRATPPRQGTWSIPGGKQEWGETLEQAGIREIREETGLTVSNLKLIGVADGLMKDESGKLRYHLSLIDYHASWAGDPPGTSEEVSEVRWVPVTKLGPYNLWSETIRIILEGAALEAGSGEIGS